MKGCCEVCGGALQIVEPFYHRARELRGGGLCTCPGQLVLDDKYLALKPEHKEAIRKHWENKACALTREELKAIFASEGGIR